MINTLASNAVGLAILTGRTVAPPAPAPAIGPVSASSTSSSLSTASRESRAVRVAKAAFTTPFVPPPWLSREDASAPVLRVDQLRQLGSFIDQSGAKRTLPPDVQSAFTAWKALERLRLLAEAGTRTGSNINRAQFDAQFARGLSELQAWLAAAPSDQLRLAFGQPTSRTESVSVPSVQDLPREGIATSRDAPIPGLQGNEVFELRLAKPGVTDLVRIDLAQGQQPPTINSVVEMFNAGITSIPHRAADGTILLDAAGNPIPQYLIKVDADLASGEWSIVVVPAAQERMSIRQPTDAPALVIATGATALDSPTSARLLRINDPLGVNTRETLATISAQDGRATRLASMQPQRPPAGGGKPVPPDIRADTVAWGVTTDADGNSYVLGTTPGDLGASLGDGRNEIFLTKFDTLGRVIWQDSLGFAGTTEAAAVSMAPDGSIVVAGTISDRPGRSTPDSDMLVARFSSDGRELMNTVVSAPGVQTATALAVTEDNRIFVAGSQASGNAVIVQFGADGAVAAQRELEGVRNVVALSASPGEGLLVLAGDRNDASLLSLGEGLQPNQRLSLGAVTPRAMTRGGDGQIWVAANAQGLAGVDGVVFAVDRDLTDARQTRIGSGGDEQLDSIAVVNDVVFVGGRTTGSLAREPIGATDGFVARIEAATGALGSIDQFGQPTIRMEPVRIASAPGGGSGLKALGLASGDMRPDRSKILTAVTALRAGDEFSLRVADRPAQRIVIEADDTLASLTARIRRQTRSAVSVTMSEVPGGGGRRLRLNALGDQPVQLLSGPTGRDALAKLGLEPQRLAQPPRLEPDAPTVRPGGAFGLGLSTQLNLRSREQAAFALSRIREAIATTQTGFRSLYWNETKAQIVEAGSRSTSGASAYQVAQLRNYTAALNRLSSGASLLLF